MRLMNQEVVWQDVIADTAKVELVKAGRFVAAVTNKSLVATFEERSGHSSQECERRNIAQA